MSTLTVDNIVGATTATTVKLPAGCILQTVSTTKTDTFTSSSSSLVDITGMTVTITPKFATSKVLVRISQHYRFDRYGFSIKIMRGSTAVHAPVNNYMVYNSDSNADQRSFLNYEVLDSPSSTSALTYKTQVILATSATVNLQLQGNDFFSFITLMEIAQ